MSKNGIDKINWGNVAISIISVLVSLFALVKSCITDEKLEETNYRISSVEYRPRLKCSNPKITSFKVNIDSVPLNSPHNPLDSIGNIYVNIKLKLKVNVTNIGNRTAKISGWVITDTLSELDIIRKRLFSIPKIKGGITDKSIFPHYLQELTPQDSSFIEFDYDLQEFNEKGFIIHILLFYENELQQLFDTYYWVHYDMKRIMIKSSSFTKEGSIDLKQLTKEINEAVDIKSDNNDSEIYSKELRDKVTRELKD